MVRLRAPSLTFNPYDGRMGEISPSTKPFPHRAGNIAKFQYAADWKEYGEEAAYYYLNLTRKLYGYMTPYASMAPRPSIDEDTKRYIESAIRHMYSPDLKSGWGIHVVQELKLLVKKKEREGLNSTIDEFVQLVI